MTIDVSLRISGLDLSSSDVFDHLSDEFPEVVFQGGGKVVTATVFVNSSAIVEESVQKARQILYAFPDARFQGVDRDHVSITDIAGRVGISREGVRKWTLDESFPLPADHIESVSMDVWMWSQVVCWLKDNRCIDMDEQLPTVSEMIQIDNCLYGNPGAVDVEWHSVEVTSLPQVSRASITPFQTAARLPREGMVRQEFEFVSSL